MFAQTRLPREIVVVDDASTDGTREVVAEAGQSSAVPVRLIALTENSGGPARPMNVGIEAARGGLIAVVDQDDVLDQRKIEVQAEILEQHPDVSFAFSWCGRLEDRETVRPRLEVRESVRQAGVPRDGHYVIQKQIALRLLIERGQFTIGFPGFMFRRCDWQSKGGMDESLLIAADYDMLCWLCSRGHAALAPIVAYWRREHAGNACHRKVIMFSEFDRLRVHYVQSSSELRRDSGILHQLSEELIGRAYWFRQGGYYREAFDALRLALSCREKRRQSLQAMLKLPLHWTYRKVLGIAPELSSYTSAETE